MLLTEYLYLLGHENNGILSLAGNLYSTYDPDLRTYKKWNIPATVKRKSDPCGSVTHRSHCTAMVYDKHHNRDLSECQRCADVLSSRPCDHVDTDTTQQNRSSLCLYTCDRSESLKHTNALKALNKARSTRS